MLEVIATGALVDPARAITLDGHKYPGGWFVGMPPAQLADHGLRHPVAPENPLAPEDLSRARVAWQPPKLAVMRVLRLIAPTLHVIEAEDTAATSLEDVALGALATAPLPVQRDWEYLAILPRLDPMLIGFVGGLGLPGAAVDPLMDIVWPAAVARNGGATDNEVRAMLDAALAGLRAAMA